MAMKIPPMSRVRPPGGTSRVTFDNPEVPSWNAYVRFFTWIEGAEEAIMGGERAKSTVLDRKIGYSWIRLIVKLRRYRIVRQTVSHQGRWRGKCDG